MQARLKDNIRQFRDEKNEESGLATEENLIFALFEDDDTAVPVVHISCLSRCHRRTRNAIPSRVSVVSDGTCGCFPYAG